MVSIAIVAFVAGAVTVHSIERKVNGRNRTISQREQELKHRWYDTSKNITESARLSHIEGDDQLLLKLASDRANAYQKYRNAVIDLYKMEGIEPPLWTTKESE